MICRLLVDGTKSKYFLGLPRCDGKSRRTVRYAVSDYTAVVRVMEYGYFLVKVITSESNYRGNNALCVCVCSSSERTITGKFLI